MKLHIFNPEHDIALASGASAFTAPHAARELRSDMGYLPALWADDGDMVLVEDVEASVDAVRHLKCRVADVLFVMPEDLSAFQMSSGGVAVGQIEVCPWGWDAALARELTALNPDMAALMPDAARLAQIRAISNRRWASAHLLAPLVEGDATLVGSSEYMQDCDTLDARAAACRQSVIKAPWSSSGRGLRYIEYPFDTHQQGWASNVIRKQGGVMIEPYYNKVRDFGMEFESRAGEIVYRGLSLFQTVNGTYAGNIVTTDADKRDILSKYLPLDVIDRVRDRIVAILSPLFRGVYEGPFGIDMMIVASDGHLKLHPCVELNLRRTMGHVALALSPREAAPRRLMRITCTNKYRLHVSDTQDNALRNTML